MTNAEIKAAISRTDRDNIIKALPSRAIGAVSEYFGELDVLHRRYNNLSFSQIHETRTAYYETREPNPTVTQFDKVFEERAIRERQRELYPRPKASQEQSNGAPRVDDTKPRRGLSSVVHGIMQIFPHHRRP